MPRPYNYCSATFICNIVIFNNLSLTIIRNTKSFKLVFVDIAFWTYIQLRVSQDKKIESYVRFGLTGMTIDNMCGKEIVFVVNLWVYKILRKNKIKFVGEFVWKKNARNKALPEDKFVFVLCKFSSKKKIEFITLL